MKHKSTTIVMGLMATARFDVNEDEVQSITQFKKKDKSDNDDENLF